MQVFRQPFWKADTSRTMIKPYIYLSIATVGFIAHHTCSETFEFHPLALIPIFLLFSIFPVFFTQYFYLTFTDDQLLIKNSIYTFWHREYNYKDIIKVCLEGGKGLYGRPYIEVYTNKNPNYAWSYIIEHVAPEDYPDLLDTFKAKNITVETDQGFDYLVDKNFTRF